MAQPNRKEAEAESMAAASASNVASFSKEALQKQVENIKKCQNVEAAAKEKYDLAKGATRTAYNNAGKMGIPDDQLKFVIEKGADFDDDFKSGVNIIQEMLGQAPLFNFEPTEH